MITYVCRILIKIVVGVNITICMYVQGIQIGMSILATKCLELLLGCSPREVLGFMLSVTASSNNIINDITIIIVEILGKRDQDWKPYGYPL